MSDNWNFYFLTVDHKLASIFVDLGIGSDPPKTDFPNMAYIQLHMRSPRSDGLSSQEEFEQLKAIEEAFQREWPSGGNAVYVGRNTCGGTRDFFFYTRDPELFDRTATETMKSFPAYVYELGGRADPDWNVYFDFLYPSPKQMQVMGNRDVCENLKRHGDTLQKPRRIDHWAYFQDEASMNRYAMKVTAKGYDITERGQEEDSDPPFKLMFGRDDTPAAIDEVVIPLFELAQEFGGRYDGWETLVIKDGTPAAD